MNRIILAVVIGWGFFPGPYTAYAESEVKATPKVQVAEKLGETDAYIGPVYFPAFKAIPLNKSDNDCAAHLEELSNQKMSKYIDENGFDKEKGGFLRPNRGRKYSCRRDTDTGECLDIKRGLEGGSGIDVESGKDLSDKDKDGDITEPVPGKVTLGDGDDAEDYYDLADLSGDIDISSGYEKQGKILFSWGVRVEGILPDDCDHFKGDRIKGIAVWPVLCYTWRGTSEQDYGGGQVKTQLYIKGAKGTDSDAKDEDGYVAVGVPFEMTVPQAKPVNIVSYMPTPDPTLEGSYMLKPSDFAEGELPEKISYKLKWSNNTALRIKSPQGQRSLGYTFMPVTQE